MDFGPNFCRWVSILCKDACARIIVNGDLSEVFWLARSVRQGCPLGPALFVLVADISVRLINQDKDIGGFVDPFGQVHRASTFADDSLALVKILQKCLVALFGVIMLFCRVSGCLVNWVKTFAIVSPDNMRLPAPFDMVKVLQVGEHSKYLGLPASPGKEDLELGKYVIHKVIKRCASLQLQYLTVTARVVVLNFLLDQIL